MPRGIVGLLAAVGTAMSALVAFASGALIWLTIAVAAAAWGLAAYGALPPIKKILSCHQPCLLAARARASNSSRLRTGTAQSSPASGSCRGLAPPIGPGSSRSFRAKLILVLFALVRVHALPGLAYYPCQRLGA
jgi:hypothetical protein